MSRVPEIARFIKAWQNRPLHGKILELLNPLKLSHAARKMKRKLNDDQVPTPASPVLTQNAANTFSSLGLDSRLLQAIAKEGFSSPTPVQIKAIPLSLEGKDILGAL